ncbi:MAG: GtrA family protein [Desulfamplus sp.]|nr:GtrA family protein [Desulfamplus sp.]
MQITHYKYFNQLIRYCLASIIGYSLVFIGTFFFHKIIGMLPEVSYFITVTLVYIIQYILNTKYVFNSKFSKASLTKYIIMLILFWGFNNILYNILLKILNIQYLTAVLINIAFFSFARFFIQKRFIFYQ